MIFEDGHGNAYWSRPAKVAVYLFLIGVIAFSVAETVVELWFPQWARTISLIGWTCLAMWVVGAGSVRYYDRRWLRRRAAAPPASAPPAAMTCGPRRGGARNAGEEPIMTSGAKTVYDMTGESIMRAETTVPSHITLDEKGVARIDNTRWKVIHIAADKRHHNTTPEQMQQQWPDLTIAQIYAALAYYYDHQAEMDAEMDHLVAETDRMRRETPESPGRKKLRELGHLP